jgi:hypothetical protein
MIQLEIQNGPNMQTDLRLRILNFLRTSNKRVDFFMLSRELEVEVTELVIELDTLIHEKRFVTIVGLGESSSYEITSAGIEALEQSESLQVLH